MPSSSMAICAGGAGTLTDDHLRQSLTIPVGQPEERTLYSKVNDLGKPQFILASFRLFGVSLRAPHYLVFALLGASLLLFVAAHARDPDALCLSLFVVLSFYALAFLLGLSSQLWTVIDVRFLSALAILPCLHLALVVSSRHWSWRQQLLGVPQAALIAVACQLRSSAVWTIVCVIAVAAWTVVRARKNGWAPVATAAAPLMVIGVALLGLTMNLRQGLQERHLAESPARHVFWHSLHTGFAAGPELADRYQLGFGDGPSYRAVMRYLRAADDPGRIRAVFGTDGSVIDFGRMNSREYERAARDVVMQMVRDDPRAVVETIAFYKPLMFVRTLAWATGLAEVDVRTIAMEPEWLLTPAERIAHEAYLRWFRPAATCLFLLAVACACWSARSAAADVSPPSTRLVVPAMFLTSLLPGLCVWPAFHWVGDAMITTGLLVYTVLARAAWRAFQTWRR